MAAALAGVVHDCQGTDNHERNRKEDNCYGGLHSDLPNTSLPAKFTSNAQFKLHAAQGEILEDYTDGNSSC
jgi:hypothetical protein